jgi:hypothetical protein
MSRLTIHPGTRRCSDKKTGKDAVSGWREEEQQLAGREGNVDDEQAEMVIPADSDLVK